MVLYLTLLLCGVCALIAVKYIVLPWRKSRAQIDEPVMQYDKVEEAARAGVAAELSEFLKGTSEQGDSVVTFKSNPPTEETEFVPSSLASAVSADDSRQTRTAIGARPPRSEANERAIAVLDRVCSVVRRDGESFASLLECQAKARELRSEIMNLPATETHPAALQLTEGKHPFSRLLRLIEHQEELPNDECLSLHEMVAESFGFRL